MIITALFILLAVGVLFMAWRLWEVWSDLDDANFRISILMDRIDKLQHAPRAKPVESYQIKRQITKTSRELLHTIVAAHGGFVSPSGEAVRQIVREVRSFYSEIDRPTAPKPNAVTGSNSDDLDDDLNPFDLADDDQFAEFIEDEPT